MQVLTEQCLILNSLLSYKTRATYRNLRALIAHLHESTRILGYEIVAPIVFNFKENVAKDGESILDMEFLIPVNKEFKSNEYYVYKPKLRLVNAARMRHTDVIDNINISRREMQHYLINNDMTPSTDFYYQILSDDDRSSVVDIYVGLNESIV